MYQTKKNAQGMITLLAVIGLGLIAFGAAISLVSGAVVGVTNERGSLFSDQNFYAASAGANESIYLYIQGKIGSGSRNITLADGSIASISVDDTDPANVIFRSTEVMNGIVRTIVRRVDLSDLSRPNFLSWLEE